MKKFEQYAKQKLSKTATAQVRGGFYAQSSFDAAPCDCDSFCNVGGRVTCCSCS